MKLTIMALAFASLGGMAMAQSGAVGVGTATSTSGATSQSGSSAGASAGYTVNNYSDGKSALEYQGEYTVKNAPSVTAPAVFGGGHPCLAGKSGGISVIGGGLSYGQGEPEPACMAWVMGQPEVAIRIMMMNSPDFCRAIGNVGYYRVGNQVLPIQCGKEVKRGGIDTTGAQPRPTRISTRNSAPPTRPDLFSECYMRDDGKIGIVYTGAGKKNKEVAGKACLSQLGY